MQSLTLPKTMVTGSLGNLPQGSFTIGCNYFYQKNAMEIIVMSSIHNEKNAGYVIGMLFGKNNLIFAGIPMFTTTIYMVSFENSFTQKVLLFLFTQ